jgi:cytochrome c556
MPPDFAAHLEADSNLAQTLEDLLTATNKDPAKLSAQFKLITASCKDCHVKHRD